MNEGQYKWEYRAWVVLVYAVAGPVVGATSYVFAMTLWEVYTNQYTLKVLFAIPVLSILFAPGSYLVGFVPALICGLVIAVRPRRQRRISYWECALVSAAIGTVWGLIIDDTLGLTFYIILYASISAGLFCRLLFRKAFIDGSDASSG